MKVEDCRIQVKKFAILMEEKLRLNEDKAHWSYESLQHLSMRLDQEHNELRKAFCSGDSKAVGYEAADVANFAMMIADNCGSLE